jgi:excisionase family DNA binding protein
MITAQKVYREIIEMPLKEREKLFSVIAKRGFDKDFYRHDEVFDEIRQSPFTIKEASEYLEVSGITLRRWITAGKLETEKIGKSIVIDVDKLKIFKKNSITRKT